MRTITVEITQEIIDLGSLGQNLMNSKLCIGAQTLRHYQYEFGADNEAHVSWGVYTGAFQFKDLHSEWYESYDILDNPVSMMRITQPQTVVFKQVS